MAALSGGSGSTGKREAFVEVCLHCYLEQALQESGERVEPISGHCSGAYNALMTSVLRLAQPCMVLRGCANHKQWLRSTRSSIKGRIGAAKRRGED
jgi:hypothetical protein